MVLPAKLGIRHKSSASASFAGAASLLEATLKENARKR
jgi:hypothetical protein